MNKQRSLTPSPLPPQDKPTLEWEAIPHNMLECMELEQKLSSQEQALAVFCQMRQDYVARWNILASQKSMLGEEFVSVEQLWHRLWAEPQDPVSFAQKHYQPALQKLHEQSLSLLQELQQSLQARFRVLASWRNMLHEMSHRLHLLQKLDGYLEPLEARLQQHVQAKQQEELRRQKSTLPTNDTVGRIDIQSMNVGDTLEMAVDEEHLKQQFEPEPELHLDQREHTRLVLGTVVNFGEDEHAFYTGFSENISEGGLFVATYTMQPKIGERFRLNFSLPQHPTIEVIGEVVWIRVYSPNNPNLSPGFGCRFIQIEEEDKDSINAFIQEQGALFVPELSV